MPVKQNYTRTDNIKTSVGAKKRVLLFIWERNRMMHFIKKKKMENAFHSLSPHSYCFENSASLRNRLQTRIIIYNTQS